MGNLIGLLVCGLLGLTSALAHAATLESPAPGSNVSGLGYIGGWKCHHGEVTVRIDGGGPIRMATRMPRADTQSVCQGATDNGFIAQFTWAFLAEGSHTVVAYDNGVEFARSTFTVATFGEEFVEEAQGECTIADFPSTGETAHFVWNESTQHLELVGGIPPPSPPPLIGALASHGRFHVIRHELSEAQDHDAECRAQLGSGFRLADWNDIVRYYQGGGSLSDFTTRLRMVPAGEQPEPGELGNGYRVSRDGNAIYSGRRHYFVARHDDNHHVSLGSWYGTGGYALCYGDGEDGQEELRGRSGEVRVNIEWDADVDLDLYVTNPCGQTFGYNEQTTATCQGSAGEWDYDDQGDGYRDDAPHAENIVWGRPAPQGSYRVALNYFDGSVSTNYTIRVFYGEESRTYTGQIGPAEQGTRRQIADFQFQ